MDGQSTTEVLDLGGLRQLGGLRRRPIQGHIERTILNHTALRDSSFQRGALVQAWREAEAYAASIVEQTAEDPGDAASRPQLSNTQSGVKPEAIQNGGFGVRPSIREVLRRAYAKRVPRAPLARLHAF